VSLVVEIEFNDNSTQIRQYVLGAGNSLMRLYQTRNIVYIPVTRLPEELKIIYKNSSWQATISPEVKSRQAATVTKVISDSIYEKIRRMNVCGTSSGILIV